MAERRGKADGTEDAEFSVLPAENATGNYVKILQRLPVKIINLMRNLGGSVGVSFTPTMLQERLQFHHARLAEHVTAYNGYAGTRLPPIDAHRSGQAGIMSYLDIFWMLGMLGLLIWPLALFLPRMPKGAAPAH